MMDRPATACVRSLSLSCSLEREREKLFYEAMILAGGKREQRFQLMQVNRDSLVRFQFNLSRTRLHTLQKRKKILLAERERERRLTHLRSWLFFIFLFREGGRVPP